MSDSEGSWSGGTAEAFQYHIVWLYQTLTSRSIGARSSGMALEGRKIHVRFISSAAFNPGRWLLCGINFLSFCGTIATGFFPNHCRRSERRDGAGGPLLRFVGWVRLSRHADS